LPASRVQAAGTDAATKQGPDPTRTRKDLLPPCVILGARPEPLLQELLPVLISFEFGVAWLDDEKQRPDQLFPNSPSSRGLTLLRMGSLWFVSLRGALFLIVEITDGD
jgi:hypothetical protein